MIKRLAFAALACGLLFAAPAQAQMTTIRTMTAVAAEGYTAPTIGSFIDLGGTSRYVEVSFAAGGSVANGPTSVTLLIWYAVGSTIRVASKQIILAADVAAPASVLLDVNAAKFWVTVAAFDGGAVPTLTLTASGARRVP